MQGSPTEPTRDHDAMQRLILVLAILMLPLQLLACGMERVRPGVAAANRDNAQAPDCAQAQQPAPACVQDETPDIAGSADAMDSLHMKPAPVEAHRLGAFEPQSTPFPSSFHPLTASPPPRA